MAKIPFDDVTPPGKRSIRNIPIPNGGNRKVSAPITKAAPRKVPGYTPEEEQEIIKAPNIQKVQPTQQEEVPLRNQVNNSYEYYYPNNSKDKSEFKAPGKSKKKFVVVTVLLLLVAGFIGTMMTVLASATISIVPKSQNLTVETKINTSIQATEGAVRYEVTKLTKSQTVSVQATGEEAAKESAVGRITIYNNFSSDPQRLITRTRFETPEGLIYRIQESIVVPGKTASGPGSIEAQVVADEPGEKYNIKKTDFTVPGFKSDATRYKGFYARGTTDMTGGFVGTRKTVSETDKNTALQNIDKAVQADLQKELQSKVPDGLVLLSGAIAYMATDLPQKEDGSSVELGREVTAYALLLNKSDLSNIVTSQYLASSTDWTNITPAIQDFSGLTISALPEVSVLQTGDNLSVDLSGLAKAMANIDAPAINKALLGAPRADAKKLLDQFPSIKSLSATIRPIWKMSFPNNPLRVHIRIDDN